MERGCSEIVGHLTISKESAIMLGFDTTFELFKLRERRIQGTLGSNLKTAIREAFKSELDLVGRSELRYRR